jgi:hypothetical protein
MTQTTDRLRATLFRPGYPDPGMRVSDADRAAIADLLARHFGDGRLDQAEFDDRVSRAMAAKTTADFHGLLDDLPGLPPDPSGTPGETETKPPVPGYATARRRESRWGPTTRVVLAVLLAFVAARVALHALTDWFGSLALLGLLAVIIVILAKGLHRPGR